MQRFEGEVIDHKCVGFDLGTTFICNKQLQLAPTTLDVTVGRVILRVSEVLGSGVLLLE
jgi:hypothetical protein